MGKWTLPLTTGGHMERDTGIYYQTMTSREVEERLKVNDVLLLPIGSTENHGANAPYGEDTFLDTRICELVAQATGCTVAEPIWYGSHPYHHLGMPGTVIIPEDILSDYISYVFAGFWNTGFRKIIVVNGHGQDYVIPAAIHKFGKKWQVPSIILYYHFWKGAGKLLSTKEKGGMFDDSFIHADEVEQSFSLALFPEFCKQEYAEETTPSRLIPPGHVNNSAEDLDAPINWYNALGTTAMECIHTPEGVIGNPKKADAAKAIPGLERILDRLELMVNDIITTYPAGELPPIDQVTQRKREDIEAVIQGPTKGGRHLYTLEY